MRWAVTNEPDNVDRASGNKRELADADEREKLMGLGSS